MEKEFITYEMAFKLKQLGFDEPCFGWFTDFEHFYLNNIKNGKMFKDNNGCLAPTWQSAFRWFRNKHRIHFRIEKYDEGTWWVSYGSWTSDVFDSYEQAENKSLEKLIEFIGREKLKNKE